jgi:hypothetical protein
MSELLEHRIRDCALLPALRLEEFCEKRAGLHGLKRKGGHLSSRDGLF